GEGDDRLGLNPVRGGQEGDGYGQEGEKLFHDAVLLSLERDNKPIVAIRRARVNPPNGHQLVPIKSTPKMPQPRSWLRLLLCFSAANGIHSPWLCYRIPFYHYERL